MSLLYITVTFFWMLYVNIKGYKLKCISSGPLGFSVPHHRHSSPSVFVDLRQVCWKYFEFRLFVVLLSAPQPGG